MRALKRLTCPYLVDGCTLQGDVGHGTALRRANVGSIEVANTGGEVVYRHATRTCGIPVPDTRVAACYKIASYEHRGVGSETACSGSLVRGHSRAGATGRARESETYAWNVLDVSVG